LEQKFFAEDSLRVLNEDQKEVEHLWRDGNVYAVPAQSVIFDVESELPEAV
jgi:hypothetical protein